MAPLIDTHGLIAEHIATEAIPPLSREAMLGCSARVVAAEEAALGFPTRK